MTSAKATVLPTALGSTFQGQTNIGGGVQSAFVLSVTKNFRVVGNGLWGIGVGRYMIGLGPQVVVVPVQLTPAGFSASLSGVHAGNGVLGLELQATPKTLFAAYYGGAYFARNSFPDITATPSLTLIRCTPAQPLQNRPCIGYGGFNSANTNNRAIQEPTFDWTQTFWRNPQYGAVLMITQYSYVTRAPWFVSAGAPKNAHLSLGFLSLRYVLP